MATFLEQESQMLLLIASVVLLALPLLSFLASLVTDQTIKSNYPMRHGSG